jgi:hypothetical protein
MYFHGVELLERLGYPCKRAEIIIEFKEPLLLASSSALVRFSFIVTSLEEWDIVHLGT